MFLFLRECTLPVRQKATIGKTVVLIKVKIPLNSRKSTISIKDLFSLRYIKKIVQRKIKNVIIDWDELLNFAKDETVLNVLKHFTNIFNNIKKKLAAVINGKG